MPDPHARQLRRNSTGVEQLLWQALRDRRFHGYKFRRQHPIGPFIVDFACIAVRLVIEADGGQYADSAEDARRTAWLRGRGWRVIRFWNNDIRANPDAITDDILSALRDPHPRAFGAATSPAKGGRGGGQAAFLSKVGIA